MNRPAITAALETLYAGFELLTERPDGCAACHTGWAQEHAPDCPSRGIPPFVFDALTGEYGRVIA